MKHRLEIDGLRAFAVLPVVLLHAGVNGIPGGFLGVDVFFVISGYLITGIVHTQISEGRFSLIEFYERRARRILPALFVMLAIVGFVGWFVFVPGEMDSYAQAAVATVAFLSNVFFWWKAQDYFAPAAGDLHLIHTWSLGVEEQFYLLFPPTLLLMWAIWKNKNSLLLGVVLLAVASFAACLWIRSVSPTANFFLLPFRAWELAAGALVALAPIAAGRKAKEALSALGLVMLLLAYLALDERMALPGPLSLVPVVGTAMILLFSGGTAVGALLSWRPFVWVGLISYSLYLWHQPILVVGRAFWAEAHPWFLVGIGTAVSIFVAYLSWYWVEQPVRRARLGGWRLLGYISTFAIIIGSGGVWLWWNEGAPWRFEGRQGLHLAQHEMPTRQNGYCFLSFGRDTTVNPDQAAITCELGSSAPDAKHVLLFGDSYAAHYEPFWDVVGNAANLRVVVVTTNWCHPSNDSAFLGPPEHRAFLQCEMNRRWVAENIASFDAVILGTTWGDLQLGGLLGSEKSYLARMNTQTTKVVLLPAPYQHRRAALDRYVLGLTDFLSVDTWEDSQQTEAFSSASGEIARAFVISRQSLFDVEGAQAGFAADGRPYSLDGGHMSVAGSLAAASNYMNGPEFEKLLRYIDGSV